jgi:hypothetical protein
VRNMEFNINYTIPALIDADETAEWYNHKIPGLGFRFLQDMYHTVDSIERNPFSFSVLEAPVRKAGFNKFPYIILFTADENNVFIIAVVSTYRSNRYIRKRIRNR